MILEVFFPLLGFSHSLVAMWDSQQDRGKLGHLELRASSLATVEPLTG